MQQSITTEPKLHQEGEQELRQVVREVVNTHCHYLEIESEKNSKTEGYKVVFFSFLVNGHIESQATIVYLAMEPPPPRGFFRFSFFFFISLSSTQNGSHLTQPGAYSLDKRAVP